MNVKQLFKVNKYLANNKFRGGRVLQLITTVNQFYRACFITEDTASLAVPANFRVFPFFFFWEQVSLISSTLSTFLFQNSNLNELITPSP